MAVRVAISELHLLVQDPDHLGKDENGRRLTQAYKDRLDEVLAMIVTSPSARRTADRVKVDRILQLAGIDPGKATLAERDLAEGYAITDAAIDESATRLRRALGG